MTVVPLGLPTEVGYMRQSPKGDSSDGFTDHIALHGCDGDARIADRARRRADPGAAQPAGRQRGHYSEDLHGIFRDAGFYRIVRPKLFGGYEFDFKTYFQVVTRISRGHPGAGWCFCLSGSHAWLLASIVHEVDTCKKTLAQHHRASAVGAG